MNKPDATKVVIPKGWRKLRVGTSIKAGDCYHWFCRWWVTQEISETAVVDEVCPYIRPAKRKKKL